MLERDLQQLGLSDKEAKVYLAVLELGPATVIQIVSKASINRPTAYVQIQKLMALGLMSSHERGKKTYFAAEPPERLLELVRIKQTEVEEQSKRLKEILPELQTLFDTAEERPKVRFYEGKTGILSLADDIFKKRNTTILTVYSADLFTQVFSPEEDKKFEKARQEKNIKVRALYTRSAGPFEKASPKTFDEKFVPVHKFPITAVINIYDNKIAAFTLRGKLIGVIIESKELAETLHSIFELAWQGAER